MIGKMTMITTMPKVKRITTGLLGLLLFSSTLLFSLQASSPSTPASSNYPLNETVYIWRDENGFYVNADLVHKDSKSRAAPGVPTSAKMMLYFGRGWSLLIDSCLDFTQYDCKQYPQCERQHISTSGGYPTFEVKASSMFKTELYLEYNNWILKSGIKIASGCESKKSSVGRDRVGMIGFGVSDEDSDKSFLKSKAFSIYFSRKALLAENKSKAPERKGRVNFALDPSNVETDSTPIVLQTNSNWIVTLSDTSTTIRTKSTSFKFEGELTFDIHADTISFPERAFKKLIENFQKETGLTCDEESLFQPECHFSDHSKIGNLTNITISIRGEELDLPPEIYVKNESWIGQKSINLNLKAIGPLLPEQNFVVEGFERRIYLDARFMSYYHVVFNFTEYKKKVEIYKSVENWHEDDIEESSSLVGVISAVVLIAVILTLVCCHKLRRGSSKQYVDLDSSTDFYQEPSHFASTQEPKAMV